jgi:hypothetical protein
MPMTCTICRHESIQRIDKELLTDSLRNIAKRHGLSLPSLNRHKAHLPKQLAKSELARKIGNADDLMSHAQRLLEEAERMARKAESEGSIRLVLLAIAEQRNVLKLFADIMGEIKTRQEHSGFVGVQLIHSIPQPDRLGEA